MSRRLSQLFLLSFALLVACASISQSSTPPSMWFSSTESVGAPLDDYSSLWLSSTPPRLALDRRRLRRPSLAVDASASRSRSSTAPPSFSSCRRLCVSLSIVKPKGKSKSNLNRTTLRIKRHVSSEKTRIKRKFGGVKDYSESGKSFFSDRCFRSCGMKGIDSEFTVHLVVLIDCESGCDRVNAIGVMVMNVLDVMVPLSREVKESSIVTGSEGVESVACQNSCKPLNKRLHQLPAAGFSKSSVFLNVYHLIFVNGRRSHHKQNRVFPWVMWQVWKVINILHFEKTQTSSEMTSSKTVEDAEKVTYFSRMRITVIYHPPAPCASGRFLRKGPDMH
ncbi:hypothetical protein YC2023_014848 [Brassica napus]